MNSCACGLWLASELETGSRETRQGRVAEGRLYTMRGHGGPGADPSDAVRSKFQGKKSWNRVRENGRNRAWTDLGAIGTGLGARQHGSSSR